MFVLALFLAGQAGVAPATATSDPVTVLGAELAGLRAAVDTAADQLAQQRQAGRDEQALLERRVQELEGRLAQLALVERELAERDRALTLAHAGRTSEHTAALAPVRDVVAALHAHIDRVPFRAYSRHERLAAVERSLQATSTSTAVDQLWPIVLDEARLLYAVERARQPVELDGARLVVEVAHVGPLVFWKAKDGRVGFATLSAALHEGAPRFVVVDDVEGRQRLMLFFDALRRDATAGTFLLPNPVVGASL